MRLDWATIATFQLLDEQSWNNLKQDNTITATTLKYYGARWCFGVFVGIWVFYVALLFCIVAASAFYQALVTFCTNPVQLQPGKAESRRNWILVNG